MRRGKEHNALLPATAHLWIQSRLIQAYLFLPGKAIAGGHLTAFVTIQEPSKKNLQQMETIYKKQSMDCSPQT